MNILRLPDVKRAFGYRSDASVYNAIREGIFTKGVAIGQRARGWPDSEVQALVKARVAGKTNAQLSELVTALHKKRHESASGWTVA